MTTVLALTACSGGEPARAGATPGEAPADTTRPQSRVRSAAGGTVVFIGTSLTAGYGLDPEEAYPSLIAAKLDSAGLPYQVVNAGVSGETSAGALRRIEWLLRRPADVIVLETGANDALRGLKIDSTRANIQAILDHIRSVKPDAHIVLVQMEAPPNLGTSYTRAFRAMFPALASANGVTLMPFLLDGVAGQDSLNLPDGIHPNEEGQRIVAENVWRVLRPIVSEGS